MHANEVGGRHGRGEGQKEEEKLQADSVLRVEPDVGLTSLL